MERQKEQQDGGKKSRKRGENNMIEMEMELGWMEKCPYLSGHVSGEVTVGSKFKVAAIACSVVDHVYLPRLEEERR